MPQDQKATRLLIVDDEQDLLNLLKKVLSKKCDCDIALVTSSLEALELVKHWQPDVVLTDIIMPDMDGLQLLQSIHVIDPTISTIIMTGYGTIEIAVQALKDGAYDFFEKPFDNYKISRVVRRALERTQLLRDNLLLQQRLTDKAQLTGFIGNSPPLRRAIDLLSRLGQSDATVLIRGESGTGKEVAARTIHAMSKKTISPVFKQGVNAHSIVTLPSKGHRKKFLVVSGSAFMICRLEFDYETGRRRKSMYFFGQHR